jgi:hypothetical protein
MCPSSRNWPLKSTRDTICTMCSSASLCSVARRFTETAKSTGRIAQERDDHVGEKWTVLSHRPVFRLKTPSSSAIFSSRLTLSLRGSSFR